MKRYLCPKHAYLLKTGSRPVQLSSELCNVCRWENRPYTVKDLANELEGLSQVMKYSYENPDHDPAGFWALDLKKFIFEFLKLTSNEYRKNFLNNFNETFKE